LDMRDRAGQKHHQNDDRQHAQVFSPHGSGPHVR
jgi:hypothetical protein